MNLKKNYGYVNLENGNKKIYESVEDYTDNYAYFALDSADTYYGKFAKPVY